MEWVDCLGLTVEFAEGYVSGISGELSILRLGMDTLTDRRSEFRVKHSSCVLVGTMTDR